MYSSSFSHQSFQRKEYDNEIPYKKRKTKYRAVNRKQRQYNNFLVHPNYSLSSVKRHPNYYSASSVRRNNINNSQYTYKTYPMRKYYSQQQTEDFKFNQSFIKNEVQILQKNEQLVHDKQNSSDLSTVILSGAQKLLKPTTSISKELAKMTSTTEVKHALRKIEFPTCAKEALFKIEQLLIGRATSIKHMDLAMDLMAEFVFSEIDRRGNRKSTGLSSLQELQLLQVLCEYFSGPATEQVKNTVFLSLFPAGNSLLLRIKILCKLVSMSVCIPSPSVLHAAGIWMQQLDNTSTHSLQLAKSLVNDYFIFTPSAVSRLRTLPKIAPQFTANFLTAVAEIYLTEKRHTFIPPPQCLLETITQWVKDNYKLCTAAQNQQSALPSGAIQMAAITPFAGLLKWCILSPVHFSISKNDGNPLSKNIKTETSGNKNTELFYEELHIALLQSLGEAGTSTGPPSAVCAQHLVSVIPALQLQIAELLRLGRVLQSDVALQLSLDRLAQAAQVALTSRCMYGNIQDLLNQLDQLPHNRLLKMIIEKHKEIVL